ncbi:MAG: hypothetical protein QM820_56270 [Minicystis sp.]
MPPFARATALSTSRAVTPSTCHEAATPPEATIPGSKWSHSSTPPGTTDQYDVPPARR